MRAAVQNPFGELVQAQLSFLFDDDAPVAPVIPFPKKPAVEAVQTVIAPPKPAPEIVRNYFQLHNQLDNLGSNEAKAEHNIRAITLLKSLKEEKRTPTETEMDVLVRYTGFGGIPHVFVEGDECKMPKQRDSLKALLTDKEWSEARASTLNAHFTPTEVIDFVWKSIAKMGFEGGKILEPAVGTGNFIGRMPLEMRKKSEVAMVEPNSVAAGIAKALYPEAMCLVDGIEKSAFVPGSFDLVVSNVPFGDYRVYDKDLDRLKFMIHDYFFAKALTLVRAGGLIAFITTHGTLDKRTANVRKYIADKAEMVGAFRLASGAFHAMANTEVVADIILLRKLNVGEQQPETDWTEISYDSRATQSYNYYFQQRPNHVAGRITSTSNRFGGTSLAVKPTERSFSEHARIWLDAIPAGIYKPDTRKRSVYRNASSNTLEETTSLPIGSFVIDQGEIKVTVSSSMAEPKIGLGAKVTQRITGMIAIRDTVRELLRADRMKADSSMLRRQLNHLYDNFVRQHGYLSDRANRLVFRDDPSFPLILSLEYFDDEDADKPVRKADIFEKCTVSHREIGTSADTVGHAVALSLNQHAELNLSFMATAMGITEEEVQAQLFEADLAYLDPAKQQLVCKDEYLSGNVRVKLAQARMQAEANGAYERNVKALETVLPVDLQPDQIEIQVGASWLAPSIIEDFIESVTGKRRSVSYAAVSATWTVDVSRVYDDAAATKLYGTDELNFYELMERMLNAQDLTIIDLVVEDGKEKRIVNNVATAGVREKAEAVTERFKKWLWEDADRANYLTNLYNELYNSVVNRKYDGSHLVIPGLSAAIELRDAQKDSVWRILTSGNTLLALAVGGGKTLIQIVAAMEAKRLGLAAKPVLAVPNHMLEQFSAEFMRAYPGATLLAASKEDLVKDRRRLMLARIATGNWDAIVITHSSFEKLPLGEERVKGFIAQNLREIDDAILEVDDTRLVKQLESQKKRIEKRLESLLNRSAKDNHLAFEDLGIDLLMVDEAHLFKNLYFATKRARVSGISQAASMRAFDMYLKTKIVQESRGNDGHGIVMATATPIANAIGEMYTMQRYVQEDTLHAMKVGTFDAWANNFAREVTSIEVAPDGSGYRMHTRFAKYVNVPDLMRIFKEVAEIRTKRMLALPEPKLNGGKHTIVSLKPSAQLKDYVAGLVARAEKIRNREVEPHEDNMLCVTNDGRKAALDLRLVGCFDTLDVPTKIDACVDNIFRIWESTHETRATQIAFCDLSTPSDVKFSCYNQLREDLVYRGIPLEQIAFIHDYNTDLQKAALFRQVRSGKIRVLLGSTQKMGVGTNIQDLLIAEHHLDAPWRPADVEQRDGRILRQGNKNEYIWIFRYVTEGSFDAYIWQTLETKASFIAQVMEGKTDLRVVEDVDVAALSYAEVKALASGNPIVIEKAGVDNEVAKLSLLRRSFKDRVYELRSDIRRSEADIERGLDFISRAEKDIATVEQTTAAFVVNGISYSDPKVGGLAMYDTFLNLPRKCDSIVGQYRGIPVVVRKEDWGDKLEAKVNVYLRGAASFELTPFTTGSGVEMKLRHAVENIPEHIARKHKMIENARAQLVIYREELDKPWEHEEKLQTLLKRQAEIDDALGLMENAVGAESLGESPADESTPVEEVAEA
ncbi:DEAD/DEAH box helicase [Noviherbaspirillum pedocola]|uniref:DEAD/DEAH box helicase n=1 Tax=Noviherbaspirillum pedocola TaxID=2801341 RepID=A0A934SSN8_9BURK|nr:DEAD/DEAH box helicase [Noviherbaspirillum pedocola]MBK4736051.1 DEAD/DEAH box helicase [Noviherbaspirillum pedocola]